MPTNGELELDAIDQLVVGSARGGRRVASVPLEMVVLRELNEGDLPRLVNPPPVGSVTPTIQQLRHSHHLLARCMAEGHDQEHVALITGYSTSRISILKNDPAFAQLLAYYGSQREAVFIDVAERMKVLGISTLEEIQRRLDEKPDAMSARELMELAELMLVKGRSGPSGPPQAGVAVTVKFVTAEPVNGLVIDGEALHGAN